MLVEFPQCPECVQGHNQTKFCPAAAWVQEGPVSFNDVRCHPCSRCDGLGVLIPDEMVEAVMAAEAADGWLVDVEATRVGLAALVRHQQEAVSGRT